MPKFSAERDPFPSKPACWRWMPPPLPQPYDLERVRKWQAGRCAICGRRDRVLGKDHDHDTGLTRGFLCPRCNAYEGKDRCGQTRGERPQAFDLYRERPPTTIFGIRHMYGQRFHPDDIAADWRLHYAFIPRVYKGRDPEVLELAERLAAVNFTVDEWIERLKRARRRARTMS